VQIDADELPEVCEQYSVESVPAFLFLHAGALVDSVMGADAPALTAKAQQHATTAAIHTDAAPAPGAAAAAAGAAGVDVGGAKEPLDARLKKLTAQSPVMLFMKGSPDAPRCGFSRQIVELLNGEGVTFGHFDILTDEEVRQGLKTFSNWPTYPQLYAEGSLIGGLDIVKEMKEDGELKAALPKAALPAAEHEHGHAEEHGHEHDGCCGHEKKAGCCGEDHGHHDHGHA